MEEIELKGVAADPAAVEQRLQRAGARVTFRGQLRDRRYDTPTRQLRERDQVLRLRVREHDGQADASLDWKGPTARTGGYKVREEQSVAVGSADECHAILTALGYAIVHEIDREITVFAIDGAVIRIERYPRMDVLIEVEGAPEAIERAIVRTGVARSEFGAGRLSDFTAQYRARTGQQAAVSARELRGEYLYRDGDA